MPILIPNVNNADNFSELIGHNTNLGASCAIIKATCVLSAVLLQGVGDLICRGYDLPCFLHSYN